jgi:nicotinate-nucleotide adenylyltransferase
MSKAFFSSGQRVGLFGGSFDPPHQGHRQVAETALKALALDYVWWLVAPQNPLKNHKASHMDDRLAATQALATHPKFIVSDEENRLGTRYAVDTVHALQARHHGVHFVWLIGADNLANMHRWKNWQELMRAVPMAVYPRPGATLKAMAGPAAHHFATARCAASKAKNLAVQKAPAWTLMEGVQSPLASSELR